MTKKDQYIVEMRLLLDHWNAEVSRCETPAQAPRMQDDRYHPAPQPSGVQWGRLRAAQPRPESPRQPDAGWQ